MAISAEAPFSHHGEQGHDGGGGEINVIHMATGLVQDLTEGHLDELQVRKYPVPFRGRQHGQQAISMWIIRA